MFTKIFATFVPKMSKKTFISTILLFAFSLVLVHNFIPHHHHDELSDISHHHDKQDYQDENDEPIDLFFHLTHLVTTYELSFTFSSNYDLQKTQTLKQLVKIVDFVFRQLKIPIKPEPVYQYNFLVISQSYYSSHFRRGPPALSV